MRILDRYIAGSFLKNLVMALLGLTAVFAFQAMLSELIERRYPPVQILTLHAYMVPQTLVQMLPPAVLLAATLTLSGLNRTHELTAIRSIGVGLPRLVGVLLSLTFIASCFALVVQDRILPPLHKKRTLFYWREMKKRNDFFMDVRQNKIWYRSRNLIYNLKTFDRDQQSIQGMSVYTFSDDFDLVRVIEAERASYTPDGWKLRNGTVTNFAPEEPFPLTEKFKEMSLQIAETPRDFQEIEKEVEALRIRELWAYIDRARSAGVDTKSYEVKFHSKISTSFIPLVMCALGVPFAVRNRREGSVAKDVGVCLFFTFFYWLFHSAGLSLGTNGALPPALAAWLPSTIFAALAATLITRSQRA
jgi:lipopolysaccharide export system permease protein